MDLELKIIENAVSKLADGFEAFMADHDRAAAEIKARLDCLAAEHTERIDGLETAIRRTGHGGELSIESAGTPEEREYKAALGLYLRSGEDMGLRAMEQKALSVGSDPDGGYLVTPAMSGRISTVLTESSPR